MCHEMAHQWFGDLVTNEWWSEIMLHESLADYFEMTSIGIMYPNQSEFMDSYFVATRQEHALQVDSGYYNNTLTGGKIHPLILKPDGSFDDITYEKGGALLRMLSGTFGPTLFQEALRNYLVKYQFGNADHFQFFEEFTQVAQKYKNITDFCGNPLDVNQLMDAWVNVPHFPQIDVDLTNDGRAFVPSQEPFLPIWYLPQGYNYSWMIPTYVLDYQKGRSFKWIPPNNFSCPHFDKHIDIQTFDPYMLYNDGAPTYARVHYEEGAHNKIRQLLRQDNGTISINTKIRLIADEWAFIDRDMVLLGLPPKLHRGMQILESILNSSFSVHTTTFMAAQSVFDTIFELSRDRHEYELYLKFLIPILENFYQKVGWNGTNDDFNTNMLRERVLYYAVRFDILDSRAMAMQYWKNLSVWCAMHFDYNCNILNPNIRRAVYCGAMWDDNGSVFGQLREFLEIAEGGYYTSREITSIVSGLACAQNHTIINWILDDLYSLSNNSTRYNLYNSFSYFYNNLNASEVMADYIIKNPQKVLDGLSCYIGLPCVMEPFLDGMTGLWYTDRRKDQYNQIYNQLYPNMDIYDKAYFQTYYNVLLSANLRGQYVYPDMTRWMYDNYVPIGKSPWTVKINQTIVPYNYNLTVKPYFPSSYKYGIGKNFTFDAIVNISATILQQDTIILNSHRHMIHRIQVTANRSIINIPIAAVYRDNENAFLTIKLAQPILQKTSINIIIEYTGFIKDSPGEGEYINFDYLEVNKKKSWIFATDFEGGPSARSLVPCLDEPAYKATWSVTVQYPMDMVALSNGLEERTISLGGESGFRIQNPKSRIRILNPDSEFGFRIRIQIENQNPEFGFRF
uniref:Aminopeptidase n=1 Tax=Acrobeloides nanus TaxID=290746 RepID=A0A914EJ50_9BILA